MDNKSSRTEARRPRADDIFGEQASGALAIFELLDLAWHDCYGESTPPEAVMDDVWVCSRGRLDYLAAAAQLAVTDFRDLRMNADQIRANGSR